MTDGRFLRDNSVTCEANHVKFKTLLQDNGAHTIHLRLLEIGQGGDHLPKSGYFYIFGS